MKFTKADAVFIALLVGFAIVGIGFCLFTAKFTL